MGRGRASGHVIKLLQGGNFALEEHLGGLDHLQRVHLIKKVH